MLYFGVYKQKEVKINLISTPMPYKSAFCAKKGRPKTSPQTVKKQKIDFKNEFLRN